MTLGGYFVKQGAWCTVQLRALFHVLHVHYATFPYWLLTHGNQTITYISTIKNYKVNARERLLLWLTIRVWSHTNLQYFASLASLSTCEWKMARPIIVNEKAQKFPLKSLCLCGGKENRETDSRWLLWNQVEESLLVFSLQTMGFDLCPCKIKYY